jgi:hypothetical protein
MKVIVSGPKDGIDLGIVSEVIAVSGFSVTEIVSSGAPGTELLGEEWALARGVPVRRFQSDPARFGSLADSILTVAMAGYSDALVAILRPGVRDTFALLAQAEEWGLKVFAVEVLDRQSAPPLPFSVTLRMRTILLEGPWPRTSKP